MTEKTIKTLRLIWAGLIVETLLLGFVFYFILRPHESDADQSEFAVTLVYISYMSVLAAIPGSFKIYEKIVKKSDKNQTEEQAILKYKTALIIKYGILEFATVFSLIAYLISHSISPLYMFLIPATLIFISKPSIMRFREDFGFSEKPKAEITPEKDTKINHKIHKPDHQSPNEKSEQ